MIKERERGGIVWRMDRETDRNSVGRTWKKWKDSREKWNGIDKEREREGMEWTARKKGMNG